MSVYEWEKGSIILPQESWGTFRDGLLSKWNKYQQSVLKDAKRAYSALLRASRGKQGAKYQEALTMALRSYCEGKQGNLYTVPSWVRHTSISHLVFKRVNAHSPLDIVEPEKSDLDTKPLGHGCTLDLKVAIVKLDNQHRTVTWTVPEENHACERARSHWFSKVMFEALANVTWTPGSGGKIVGNDDYNRYSESHDDYITAEYGQNRSM